jgi:hypothetical protein
MESSCAWSGLAFWDLDFGPAECLEIKDPQIIEIDRPLTSENYQIGADIFS